MAPIISLPYSEKEFNNEEEYVDSLLKFSSTSQFFQILCGGVHVLDFFTREQSTFRYLFPHEWQEWLMGRKSIELLDFLMRDDLGEMRHGGNELHVPLGHCRHSASSFSSSSSAPPESLINYVAEIHRHSLCRSIAAERQLQQIDVTLPRHIAVGMIPKKIHEVTHFARYVDGLAEEIARESGQITTHFVDLGSGQNYLGRTLASPPFNKKIIAIDNNQRNIIGAKRMDISASITKKDLVLRNKKLYRLQQIISKPIELLSAREKKIMRQHNKSGDEDDDERGGERRISKNFPTPHLNSQADDSSSLELASNSSNSTGYMLKEQEEKEKGYIHYIHHQVENGDFLNIISQLEPQLNTPSTNDTIGFKDHQFLSPEESEAAKKEDKNKDPMTKCDKNINLMTISIHSCGNLSHHGIRSLILNDSVHAIAIIGCCYNLLSERFSEPTIKHPLLHPKRQLIEKAKISIASSSSDPLIDETLSISDPHGFPMSQRIASINGTGLSLNITARMMALQAPLNWTEKESNLFFTRHFYRALLQKVFLDWQVIEIKGLKKDEKERGDVEEKEKEKEENKQRNRRGASESTEAVIIGSLPKSCYKNFKTYARAAIEKLSHNSSRGTEISEKMKIIPDQELDDYETKYEPLKKELSITWSLMAFSASVVESLIVVDRWLYLKEHSDIVRECWVEPVFNYGISPRNLVVVGIKK
ncbi:Methyltransferase-like protein 25 [Golovinomyces cichoracearum]|uniref:Methyltransferase-like protein 25 n=1 Tax=Golovinomyces cichoracearum TaxID=62708 RepID=A0A420IU24_9PEZI|nr:Methyltransferase-like protein 25 [Golovinomyces cichoracearum]